MSKRYQSIQECFKDIYGKFASPAIAQDAKRQMEDYFRESRGLVKKGLVREWRQYLHINNGFRLGLEGSIKMMRALSEGKSPEEADKIGTPYYDGYEGFFIGKIAQTVARYHPKGDEFRKYWNKKHIKSLSEKEVKKLEGIVNPALPFELQKVD